VQDMVQVVLLPWICKVAPFICTAKQCVCWHLQQHMGQYVLLMLRPEAQWPLALLPALM
jgi:hypothetical protein